MEFAKLADILIERGRPLNDAVLNAPADQGDSNSDKQERSSNKCDHAFTDGYKYLSRKSLFRKSETGKVLDRGTRRIADLPSVEGKRSLDFAIFQHEFRTDRASS
jgi:hypothetical protein